MLNHLPVLGAPVLALLGTNGDTPQDWLHAGEALALLLLDLTVAGLAASFFNQPIEVAELRAKLRKSLGLTVWPQMLMRIGYGHPVPPAPRRVLSDVMVN